MTSPSRHPAPASLCLILACAPFLDAAPGVLRERYQRQHTAHDRRSVSPANQRHDVGDRYRVGASERRLLRRSDALAVRLLEPGTSAERWNRLTAPGSPLSAYTLETTSANGIALFKHPTRTSPVPQEETLARLRADDSVGMANPVFVDPSSGLYLVPTEEIIVALEKDVTPRDYFGADWAVAKAVPGAPDQYVLTLPGHTAEEVLSEVTARNNDTRVAWAEPNFICEIQRQFIPDDPLYPNQWHLHNSGQGGGNAGADIKAPEVWNLGIDGQGVVIAIIDDGIERSHLDLMSNIFINTNDPIDGIDNDQNGYIDDINGWNFVGDNNDPDPDDVMDTHGTPVAGLAAGVGGNGAGITGVAPRAKILPIKVLSGDLGITFEEMAAAFRYAAGLTSPNAWRGADVISTSLFFPQSAVVDSAIEDVTTLGRNGKGCPVFTTTGNFGSGYTLYELTDLAAGTYFFEWSYAKDETMSAGEDSCWIADILFPDGSFETFDAPTLPAGWDLSPFGEVPWRIEDDPSHAFGTGRYQARAGTIGDSEFTTIRSHTVTIDTESSVSFFYWVSGEAGFDGIDFWVFDFAINDYAGPFLGTSGVPDVANGLDYPGSHPASIAVGASSDFDYRSDYSQYGAGLDVLAPSDGGRSFITTTDLTGLAGDEAGDYSPFFGGTSASTPIAAGVGALMLSANPRLTAQELRTWLRRTADRIGSVAYTNGFNPFYGHGRVDAEQAVLAVQGPLLVAVSAAGGTFDFQLTRLPVSGSVIVDRSPDMNVWTSILTNAVTGVDLDLSDAIPGGSGPWFYRARVE